MASSMTFIASTMDVGHGMSTRRREKAFPLVTSLRMKRKLRPCAGLQLTPDWRSERFRRLQSLKIPAPNNSASDLGSRAATLTHQAIGVMRSSRSAGSDLMTIPL